MRNFQDTFETRKSSFICAFSNYITVLLKHFSNYTHCFFIVKIVVTIITIKASLNFNFVLASFYIKLIPLQFVSRFYFVLESSF